jgi:hypothetical protein
VLRVTVELLPGGHEAGGRTIATARLGRVSSGPSCAYQVVLHDSVIGEIGGGKVADYPRFATTIWDLVVRAIAITGIIDTPQVRRSKRAFESRDNNLLRVSCY